MARRETGCELLLISAERRTRALLLAQLNEAGYEVVALPGLEMALAALAAGRVRPALVVLDVASDPQAHPQRVKQMLRLLGSVPVVLLVGAYEAASFASLREHVAGWLTRPLRIASVVAAVQRLYPYAHTTKA